MITPFSNNANAIVFGTDDNYLKYLYVSIKSIINNSVDTEVYDIVVLHTCTDTKCMDDIAKLQKENVSIRFIDMAEYIKEYSFYISKHISVATYYRIFIPEIFSKYEKVLYLDIDTLVTSNVNVLFDKDLGNNWIGAMPDITGISRGKFVYLLTALTFRDQYFNSGVMVLDIKKLRENNFTKLCLDKVVELGNKNEGHDNNLICMVCFGHVQRLDLNYNCPTNMLKDGYMTKEFFLERLPVLFGDEIEEFWIDPKIIHYEGHGPYKPWNNTDNSVLKFADKWWEVAQQTPYYEEFTKAAEAYVTPETVIDYVHPSNNRKVQNRAELHSQYLEKLRNKKRRKK